MTRPAVNLKRGRHAGRLTLLLAATLTLGACASMSPQECRTADWQERGLRDGLEGQPRSQFSSHVEACAEAGVKPDRERYMSGYLQGLERFCTPRSGADFGERGRYYSHGTCPTALEPDFEREYRRGRAVYDARQELDRVLDRQRARQRDFDHAHGDDARKRARRDLDDINREVDRARDSVRRAERSLYGGARW